MMFCILSDTWWVNGMFFTDAFQWNTMELLHTKKINSIFIFRDEFYIKNCVLLFYFPSKTCMLFFPSKTGLLLHAITLVHLLLPVNLGNVYLYNSCVISLRLLMWINIGYTLIPWWVTMGGDITGYEDR